MIYRVRKQVRHDYNLYKRAKLHNAICCDKLGDISVGSFHATKTRGLDSLSDGIKATFRLRLHVAVSRSKVINLFLSTLSTLSEETSDILL